MNMKTMQKRWTAYRGFTLIELLLVLVILAVLATIVLQRTAGISEKARAGSAKTQVSTIGAALERFEVDVGRYPTSEEGVNALMEAPGGVAKWGGPYLQQKIVADPWGHPYVYKFPGSKNVNGYDVYSVGPDGQEGTSDDIGNWNEDAK